jgi:hypothetical protein
MAFGNGGLLSLGPLEVFLKKASNFSIDLQSSDQDDGQRFINRVDRPYVQSMVGLHKGFAGVHKLLRRDMGATCRCCRLG